MKLATATSLSLLLATAVLLSLLLFSPIAKAKSPTIALYQSSAKAFKKISLSKQADEAIAREGLCLALAKYTVEEIEPLSEEEAVQKVKLAVAVTLPFESEFYRILSLDRKQRTDKEARRLLKASQTIKGSAPRQALAAQSRFIFSLQKAPDFPSCQLSKLLEKETTIAGAQRAFESLVNQHGFISSPAQLLKKQLDKGAAALQGASAKERQQFRGILLEKKSS